MSSSLVGKAIMFYSPCNSIYKYLYHYDDEGMPTQWFLKFSENAVYSPNSRFMVEKEKMQRLMHIRSSYTNKYWVLQSKDEPWIVGQADKPIKDRSDWSYSLFEPVRVGEEMTSFMLLAYALNWIWANLKDSTFDDPYSLFTVVKVGDNVVAFCNLCNNQFRKRLTVDKIENFLNAGSLDIMREVGLVVEEAILSREIYDVDYRTNNARVIIEGVYMKASEIVKNATMRSNTIERKMSLMRKPKLGMQV
ncbi:hypothetical protein Syun_029411 [Stephania yunnanensis]|uniref:Agglutinin domain-containing protein n=1 Tax=Stephania yunnanensis TaxID=152371 RepID=A0AAP0E9W6_9MAGN